MVKVTGYARDVEVEMNVSLDECIEELNTQAEETPGDRWRVWVNLASYSQKILDKVPANALAAIPCKTRELVVTHLVRLIRKWADGVVIDGEQMIVTHDRGELPAEPGFYVKAVEPRAIDIEAAVDLIVATLLTSGSGYVGDSLAIRSPDFETPLGLWSKQAVKNIVGRHLREARK
jgi:hypothetical protein